MKASVHDLYVISSQGFFSFVCFFLFISVLILLHHLGALYALMLAILSVSNSLLLIRENVIIWQEWTKKRLQASSQSHLLLVSYRIAPTQKIYRYWLIECARIIENWINIYPFDIYTHYTAFNGLQLCDKRSHS